MTVDGDAAASADDDQIRGQSATGGSDDRDHLAQTTSSICQQHQELEAGERESGYSGRHQNQSSHRANVSSTTELIEAADAGDDADDFEQFGPTEADFSSETHLELVAKGKGKAASFGASAKKYIFKYF